jgi:hypothetical protein
MEVAVIVTVVPVGMAAGAV